MPQSCNLQPRTHYLSHQSIVLFVILPILKVRQRLQNRHSAICVQLPSKAMIQKKQRDLPSHLSSSPPHFESLGTDREDVTAAKGRSIPSRGHCDRRPIQSAIERSTPHAMLQPTFNAGRRMARCRWLRSGASKWTIVSATIWMLVERRSMRYCVPHRVETMISEQESVQ